MSDEIVFDVLCTKVLDALRALGLGKFSIRNYYYEGMWPIIKVYRSEGVILYSAAFTNEIVDRFRLEHENGLVADRIWAKVRKAAALFEEYVQTGKIVWKRVRPAPKIPLTPYYQELLCSFCQHEANTRAIGFESLRDEENVCRKFFAYLDASGYHTCQDINLVNVNDFLLFIASQRKSSMDRVRNTLKHLSAYLVSIQNCCDFSAVLTTRPAPRKKLRPAFSSKEVHTVMDAAAKNPSLSLRDTAIFAVAASLGLRAGDIVRLTLSDIDWIHHEIRFVQNKTGVELHLPLEASVGNAIANYILHERPKTQSPALFVRSRIPFDFMTSTAAGDRLRKYMKLSDVDYTPGDGKGFHSFRRYVASSMINQEVPIDIVKEILGHTQIGSMKAYMRISRDKLAMCALGLDGKLRIVPISPSVVELLKTYLDKAHPTEQRQSDDYLFFTTHHGCKNRMSTDAVNLFMKKYGETARRACPEVPERVHPHQLRHSRAMHLYRAGMPLVLLSEFLGHADVNTTRIYAWADTEMKRQAIQKVSKATAEDSIEPIWANDEEMIKRLYGLA